MTKAEIRKDKISKLRIKHEHHIEEGALFIPKLAYIPSGQNEKMIALFPSEIQAGVNIYTEFVSSEYDEIDPDRELWLWTYNPEYDTEYAKTTPHPVSGNCRYLIPIEELHQVVQPQPVAEEESVKKDSKKVSKLRTTPNAESFSLDDLPDPDEDAPIDQMTIRDRAAIEWMKPVSKKKWLNDLIINNF